MIQRILALPLLGTRAIAAVGGESGGRHDEPGSGAAQEEPGS